MSVKALRHAHEAVGNFGEFFAGQSRVNFILRFVTAMGVRRPVLRQFAEMRNLLKRPSLGLLLFVLFAYSFGNSGGVDAGGLGINLPKLWMVLDAFVELGLRDQIGRAHV